MIANSGYRSNPHAPMRSKKPFATQKAVSAIYSHGCTSINSKLLSLRLNFLLFGQSPTTPRQTSHSCKSAKASWKHLKLDPSAAFEKVDHQILLRRLKVLQGIDDSALKWIQSYLSDRTQQVRFGDSYCALNELSCGLPQGNRYGPYAYKKYTQPP